MDIDVLITYIPGPQFGKKLQTKHMIENMLGRLSGHSMFERNANRLKMCADCRVSDMYSAKDEMTIFEVKR